MASATMESEGRASDEKDPTIQIVLHPAGEPRPALKYHLLPPFLERRPGNAAVHYLKVPHEQHRLFCDGQFWDEICKLIETPLEELRNEKGDGDWKYAWIAADKDASHFRRGFSIISIAVPGVNRATGTSLSANAGLS